MAIYNELDDWVFELECEWRTNPKANRVDFQRKIAALSRIRDRLYKIDMDRKIVRVPKWGMKRYIASQDNPKPTTCPPIGGSGVTKVTPVDVRIASSRINESAQYANGVRFYDKDEPWGVTDEEQKETIFVNLQEVEYKVYQDVQCGHYAAGQCQKGHNCRVHGINNSKCCYLCPKLRYCGEVCPMGEKMQVINLL